MVNKIKQVYIFKTWLDLQSLRVWKYNLVTQVIIYDWLEVHVIFLVYVPSKMPNFSPQVEINFAMLVPKLFSLFLGHGPKILQRTQIRTKTARKFFWDKN